MRQYDHLEDAPAFGDAFVTVGVAERLVAVADVIDSEETAARVRRRGQGIDVLFFGVVVIADVGNHLAVPGAKAPGEFGHAHDCIQGEAVGDDGGGKYDQQQGGCNNPVFPIKNPRDEHAADEKCDPKPVVQLPPGDQADRFAAQSIEVNLFGHCAALLSVSHFPPVHDAAGVVLAAVFDPAEGREEAGKLSNEFEQNRGEKDDGGDELGMQNLVVIRV